ncbi:MAG: hypothetical protein QM564_06850 [Bergeyella sp.]
MASRNVTIAIYNEEVKVAQFGQWDGYPEVTGCTLLDFLKEQSNVRHLKAILPKVNFQSEEDHKKISIHDGSIGGEILDELLKYKDLEEIILANAYAFAANSYWCEWAYVIDLDKNVLEVYRGNNTFGISKEDRFYPLYDGENEYYPVKIVASFLLENLPDEDEFIRQCSQKI